MNQKLPPAIILDHFRTTARPIMRKFMSADSCIGAVKTTILTLRLFGLEAIAFPVSFTFEVKEAKYARVNGLTPAQMAEAKLHAAGWQDVGDGGWNGHLLVLVENRWIVDPAIDQATSEEFGVHLRPEPLVFDAERRDIRAPFQIELGLMLDSGQEARVRYSSIADREYRNSEAWNDEGLPFLALVIAGRMVEQVMAVGERRMKAPREP